MTDQPAWMWVSLPYATFGIAALDGRVVDAAPIARWAIGKPAPDVYAYYARKDAGW